jgi:hypothetical protein
MSNDRKQIRRVRSKDLTQQGSAQMAAKKQKVKNKKPPPAQSRSSIGSAVIGTTFNMAATLATFASVLLCLIVAKHFT